MWYPGIPEKKMFKPGNYHLCQMLKSVWVRWARELTIGFCKELEDPDHRNSKGRNNSCIVASGKTEYVVQVSVTCWDWYWEKDISPNIYIFLWNIETITWDSGEQEVMEG